MSSKNKIKLNYVLLIQSFYRLVLTITCIMDLIWLNILHNLMTWGILLEKPLTKASPSRRTLHVSIYINTMFARYYIHSYIYKKLQSSNMHTSVLPLSCGHQPLHILCGCRFELVTYITIIHVLGNSSSKSWSIIYWYYMHSTTCIVLYV